MKFKNIPENEKPRERLIKYGVENLSNEELIAIILCVGIVFILVSFSMRMIQDKLHDIGILKALGTQNKTIVIIFGLQIFLIAILTSLSVTPSAFDIFIALFLVLAVVPKQGIVTAKISLELLPAKSIARLQTNNAKVLSSPPDTPRTNVLGFT